MKSEALEGLTTKEEILAALRSRAYRLLCDSLEYPDDALCEAVRSGVLAETLREVFGAIEPTLALRTDWGALRDAGADDELAIEYTRLFEVGASGPPCPLYGGLYGGARMKTMEEAVRFYHHFGLNLSEDPRELPDHLTTQLEFLHCLAFRETPALKEQGEPGPYRRAQRDFVARHPGRWVPRLRERIESQEPAPFFGALTGLLAGFLASEGERLGASP
jgi:DMSO reductase family type II enzyme chaperone